MGAEVSALKSQAGGSHYTPESVKSLDTDALRALVAHMHRQAKDAQAKAAYSSRVESWARRELKRRKHGE